MGEQELPSPLPCPPPPMFLPRLSSLPRLLHSSRMSTWSRLVRFQPASAAPNASPLIGEPIDPTLDVGLATYNGDKVEVEVFTGSSILAPGERTGRREVVGTLLCPLQEEEVGSIRCIGLNVRTVPVRLTRAHLCHGSTSSTRRRRESHFPKHPSSSSSPQQPSQVPFPPISPCQSLRSTRIVRTTRVSWV